MVECAAPVGQPGHRAVLNRLQALFDLLRADCIEVRVLRVYLQVVALVLILHLNRTDAVRAGTVSRYDFLEHQRSLLTCVIIISLTRGHLRRVEMILHITRLLIALFATSSKLRSSSAQTTVFSEKVNGIRVIVLVSGAALATSQLFN